MSKRRQPGEIVIRRPGSGFVSDAEPRCVQVPNWPEYGEYDSPDSKGEASRCMLSCGDKDCREWANVKVVGGEFDGEMMCHISECEMSDCKG